MIINKVSNKQNEKIIIKQSIIKIVFCSSKSCLCLCCGINYNNQLREYNKYGIFEQSLQEYHLFNQNSQSNNPISQILF